LGHSQISLTLATYSHVLPVLQNEAAQKMDELIRPIDITEDIRGIGEIEQLKRADPERQQK